MDDYDPRDLLDPEEEYEMMHADELELMRDFETEQVRPSVSSSRKSLNFTNVSHEQPTSRSASNSGTGNICSNTTLTLESSTRTRGESFHDLERDLAVPSTSRQSREESFHDLERDLAVPSTSRQSPPLPFVELDDINSPSSSTFRIAINGSSNRNDSNKRTVEDLFGDIDDIDFSEDFISNRNKRMRVGGTTSTRFAEPVDKDAITIERILQCRKRLQNQDTNVNKPTDVSFSDNSIETIRTMKVPLSRRVPKFAFMSLRNGKDEKFYARLHSENALNDRNISITEQCKTHRLLTIPFENILLEANSIVEKKFATQEREIATRTNNERSGLVAVHDESALWVEKYKPTSYLDLLSDEGTNRILLKWLKQWDKVVFGREIQVKKSNAYNNNFKFSKWKPEAQLEEELDEAGCPKRKLALLCGPPGLGKTTLAHVIAKHAGYNVVEMNASDDRSPEVFKRQLEAATQMRAVLGASPKPNCLIIDEIDGAPAVSIDLLLKFAKGELKSKGKKKNNKKGIVLKRPVICICNDVYVSALRPLRQMAFVVHFPPTSRHRLAQRLVDVARFEKVKTDIGAMLTLCEKTNNDIRNCISTIHCLKDEKITTSTIQNANIGSKDMQKGLFTAWQEIFQIQTKIIENNTTDIKNLPGQKKKTEAQLFRTKRMVSTLRAVQSNGDYDRLIQGVYENYLNIPSNDSSMRSITTGMEWFCFMDRLKTVIANSQTYTLMAYMPYSFVMWNLLFATYQRPKLNYPNMMFEIFTRQNKHYEIIQEVLKGMEVKVRAYCHHGQLLLDTLPLITYVVSPHFRQVSVQLFSAAEKETLRQLISTMIDYNLSYVQERLLDGTYEFNLDPNVDEVVEFPGVNKSKRLTYSLKLMIAREIEQEKFRRFEILSRKTHLKKGTTDHAAEEISVIDDYEMDVDSLQPTPVSPAPAAELPRTQNHLQKLTPKEIKKSAIPSMMTRDFFGRIIEKPLVKNESVKMDEIVKSSIWFRFKEGYSNAVRRTVYIKDLTS